ncbi:LuxR C-terminal-related transcriptional regulator [Actinoplanes sp. NPDC051494]|uniref:helix-turn-helix transcriptional regulator n=1 Tax=Actinoplanes sp. NPDC051494 TaxID=3363907 RepID=UPI0037A690DB
MGSAALIGRDHEIRTMSALLTTVTPGRPSVLVLDGPSGSGRTRMLREIVTIAGDRGATVIPEPEWTAEDGARRVTRELRRDPPPALSAGRLLVFGCDHPLRVDARAWDALDLLAETAPVLIVVPARPGTGPVLVDRLTSPSVRRVALAPLSPADVLRLATGWLGAPPGPDVADLLRVAAGRPGVVRELVAGLAEEGLVRTDAGRTVLTAARLPLRTGSWVSGQLAAMSPPARHLLQAASTLRSPFPLVRLTRLLRVSPLEVVPAVADALDSGLLIADGENVAFSHDRVRAIVAAGLPVPVAATLRAMPAGPRSAKAALPSVPPPAPRERSHTGVDLAVLSPRERQIAELAGLAAMTNLQIAHRVQRSPHTVNFHLRQIFQKLGIASRMELAALLRHGPGSDVSSS